ncbi:hypothetical protein [Mycolicibacterium llatzerense]|uniref:hypothetical protein n=1 Tax=Mycolicibacterium llatzerense TaxID=280871 RepID=UPI0013A708A9|nr:hypothetical protein [Mycolicibacterium llatzerense]
MDRSWGGSRILAVAGPLDGLSGDGINAALSALAGSSGTPRLAIEPQQTGELWPYQTDVAERAIHVVESSDAFDLGQLLTDIGNRTGQRNSTDVFLVHDYLVVEYPHAVGDGHYGRCLLDALVSGASRLPPDLSRNVVWRALWRHYSTEPARILALWRLRNGQRSNVVEAPRQRTAIEWRSARRVSVGRIDSARLAELQSWVAECAPGSTRVAVTSALWLAALRAKQVPVDERVVVLINCRRYLAAEEQGAVGNFAVGVPLLIGTLPPDQITSLLREVIETGWPLAAIGMGELRSRVWRSAPADANDGATVPDRIRLSVSDMGRAPYDHFPWTRDRPRHATAFVDLDSPGAMTVVVSDVGDGRNVAVTYCADTVPCDVVESAIEQICTDPIGTLTAGMTAG